MEINERTLETLIRKVLAEQLAGSVQNQIQTVDKNSGVITVKAHSLKTERFDTGKPGDQVFLKDAVTLEQSPRVMFGIMEMKEGSAFDWTLRYDEVDYIIEGTLEITVDGVTSTAGPGEIMYIPMNTSVTFSTPGDVKFMYLTYPANWSEQ